jgi:hypothetical protein
MKYGVVLVNLYKKGHILLFYIFQYAKLIAVMKIENAMLLQVDTTAAIRRL